ncbi:MAG TPA: 3-dehydroquinate synthase [Candidatus Acidoferrales bacterium]|nr:3-dehydroquinate synthase [Candidatus Acidoferrales bacterium]
MIGLGALDELPALVRRLGTSTALVVTDSRVRRLWGMDVVQRLERAGFQVPLLALPAGERSKTLAMLARVLSFAEQQGLDRGACLVALGGGTVGDLAGFAAGVWLRGIAYFQVPTTLLAMVDSSIGGKTAVNTAKTKNAVGVFWQPEAVVSDLAVLRTLPPVEYRTAFGEVVKYAVAMDAELASLLESDRERLNARDPEALEAVVTLCVKAKAAVVAADERDQGERAILNYGHTAGHALEVASGYRVAHGQAVAFGMRVAARIAARSGLSEPGLVATQDRLLAGFGLPGRLPAVAAEAILEAIPRDKKARAGQVAWVLPRELGRAEPGHQADARLVSKAVREALP